MALGVLGLSRVKEDLGDERTFSTDIEVGEEEGRAVGGKKVCELSARIFCE